MDILFLNRFLFILLLSGQILIASDIQEAIGLIEKKQYKESISILEKIVESNPEDYKAYYYLGLANKSIKELEIALENYYKSVQIYLSIDGLNEIQQILLDLDRYDESVEIGTKILSIDSKNYNARVLIAEAHFENNDFVHAKKEYIQIMNNFGKTEELIHKIGLCDHYDWNYDQAILTFREGLKAYPKSAKFRLALGMPEKVSSMEIVPEVASFKFVNSDALGVGNRIGLKYNYYPSDNWKVHFGLSRESIENLSSTSKVSNYIANSLSSIYYMPRDYIVNELTSPYSSQTLYHLLNTENYLITKYNSRFTYRYSPKWFLYTSVHTLTSNTKDYQGIVALQSGFLYKNGYSIDMSLTALNVHYHKGAQVSIGLTLPFWKHFYSTLTIFGQVYNMDISEKVYIQLSPRTAIEQKETRMKTYGFVQQEFGYNNEVFFIGIGLRAGNSRTPLISENWTYINYDLLEGGYARFGYNWTKTSIQLQLFYDTWKDSTNHNFSSEQMSLSFHTKF